MPLLCSTSVCAPRTQAPRRAAPRVAVCAHAVRHAAAASSDDLKLGNCAPLGKRLLFVADEVEEKTSGGILLPSSASTRQGGFITGEVLAVGDGVQAVKAGAKVLVSGYGGAVVDFDGRKATFLLEGDVLATLS